MAYTPLTTDLVSTSLRHYVAVFHMNSRQSPENRAGLSHKLSTTGVCLICSQRLKDPLFFHSCDLILIPEFRYLQIPILMCKFTVHRAVIPTHHFLLKKKISIIQTVFKGVVPWWSMQKARLKSRQKAPCGNHVFLNLSDSFSINPY